MVRRSEIQDKTAVRFPDSQLPLPAPLGGRRRGKRMESVNPATNLSVVSETPLPLNNVEESAGFSRHPPTKKDPTRL